MRKILAYVYMPVFFAIVGYLLLYIALSPIRDTLVAAAKMVLVQTVPTFSTGLNDIFDDSIVYDEEGNVVSGGIKDNNDNSSPVADIEDDESDEESENSDTANETETEESFIDEEGNTVTYDNEGNVTTIYKNGDVIVTNSNGDILSTSTANTNDNSNNNSSDNNSNPSNNNSSFADNNSNSNNSNGGSNTNGNNNNVSAPDLSRPTENTRYATLVCDRLGINVPLYFGDSDMALLYGAGQYAGSSLPGYGSPILIAGHNTTYFRSLENVAAGDVFKIQTNYGLYQYQVTGTNIVNDADVGSAYSLSGGEQLILYTCYPFVTLTPGTKTQRMFVYANKISGPSMN